MLTMTMAGNLDEPPSLFEPPRLWSPIEARLAGVPGFTPRYIATRPDPGVDRPWDERFAAKYGAARVFRHDYPDSHYLLAAFRRQGD